jgi:hypothetical protein
MKVKLIVDMSRKDERDCFFLTGVRQTPELSIVENEDDADYVLCHRGNPTKSWTPPNLKNQKKLVILDYTDPHDNVGFNNYGHYFKRSCVVKNGFSNRLIDEMSEDNFHSLPYSIKYVNDRDVHDEIDLNDIKKTLDVSCFFQPNAGGIRTDVTNTVKNFVQQKSLRHHIGLSGNNEIRRNGRENFLTNYYKTMKRSKIVVTCNHNNWEGDWRLYEALSVGTCVFVDKMLIPVDNPFIDGEHLVYYNSVSELRDKLNYYTKNDNLVNDIANNSKEFVYKYHTPKNRMETILNKLK